MGELEHKLGHRFSAPELIERALTHRSFAPRSADSEPSSDNEQLEYLGDAVLGLLVSEYLIRTFPHWSEGKLSKSRARLVNAGSLSAAAIRLGLGEHMRVGRGEEKTGGRQKPALLADAFEAVLAAIYLDGGLAPAREFIARALLDEAMQVGGRILEQSDFKSALQELLQARGLPPARYEVVREDGPDHQKKFWVQVSSSGAVSATGEGTNKKIAEQSAAELAIEHLSAEEAPGKRTP